MSAVIDTSSSTTTNSTTSNGFRYLSSMSSKRSESKFITFDEYDSMTDVSSGYFYEYITSDASGYHLFFDSDKAHTESEFLEFYNSVCELSSTFGDVIIAGYTNDKNLSSSYDLTYIPKSEKYVSLHICYPESIVPKNLYKKLVNTDFNQGFIKRSIDGKDSDMGCIKNIDASIYSFLNKERLMRSHLSDKEDMKSDGWPKPRIHTKCSIVGDYKNSDLLITLNGKESKTITQQNLIDCGLYVPHSYTDSEVKELNNMTTSSLNRSRINTSEPFFDDAELNLLKEILKKAYVDDGSETGDKTHEFVFKVIGIVCSATSDSFSVVDLIELFQWWADIDKNGDSWEFNDRHFIESRINGVYNKPDPMYEDYTEDSYLYGLINECVPDKKDQKTLKAYVKKVKETTFRIKSNDEYRIANTIKYVKPSELRNCRTRSERLNLLAKSVRYCQGKFIHMIDREFYPVLIDEDKFQKMILETTFNKQECSKVISQLKIQCSCEGEAYENGFQFKHLYNGNPLENVKDEHPETYEQHKEAFKSFIETNIEALDKTQDFREKLMAWKLTHPGVPSGVIDYVYGNQGTGKSLYGNLCAKLYDRFPTVNFWDSSELIPKSVFISTGTALKDFQGFNEQMDYHVFDLINETTDATSSSDVSGRNIWNEFKRMNEPVRRSEGKGKTARFVENTTNLTITTNYLFSIVPDYDDRRLYAVEANPKYNDLSVEYWKKILDKFSEPFFVKHIYDYLTKEVDIRTFTPKSIPITKTSLKIKEKALSTVQEFFVNRYNRCCKGLTQSEFADYCTRKLISRGKYGSYAKMWDDYVNLITDGEAKKVYIDGEKYYKFFPREDYLIKFRPLIELKQAKILVNKEPKKLSKDKVKKVEQTLDEYIETLKKEVTTRQSHYVCILSSDIAFDKLSAVGKRLETLGWTKDKNLTNPVTGKRGNRGWKLNI